MAKLQLEPVLLAGIVALITGLGGTIQLLATDHTVGGVLVAVGTLAAGVGTAMARARVIPVAKLAAPPAPPVVPPAPSGGTPGTA